MSLRPVASGLLCAASLLCGSCGTVGEAPAAGEFLGLEAVIYPVPPGADAAAWYAQVLGRPAQDAMPGVAGFAIGDSILGLDPQAHPGATLPVWEVGGIEAAFARLLALGAEPVTGIQEIGDARMAVVRDPFGNLLGLRETGAPP